nr:GTPase RhebL1 isoform X4 [Rattus norvegicus]
MNRLTSTHVQLPKIPLHVRPTLPSLWVTPPSPILIDQWGAACGAEPGAARLGIPLLLSPPLPPPPPALGSPAYSRCVVITWAARGARLVLVFPCVCRVSSGELLSFPVSTQACTSADLWAPSARTLTSPAGRRPVMPLVRYRKVAILGYRSVGKTSLAHQFVEGEFLKGYDPTVENTYSKTVTLGKDEFHLHLVDTAGQDKYSILPYSFIIGVHGYVLVYNVTSLRRYVTGILSGGSSRLTSNPRTKTIALFLMSEASKSLRTCTKSYRKAMVKLDCQCCLWGTRQISLQTERCRQLKGRS